MIINENVKFVENREQSANHYLRTAITCSAPLCLLRKMPCLHCLHCLLQLQLHVQVSVLCIEPCDYLD